MRTSRLVSQQAWNSQGRGSLFSSRESIRRPVVAIFEEFSSRAKFAYTTSVCPPSQLQAAGSPLLPQRHLFTLLRQSYRTPASILPKRTGSRCLSTGSSQSQEASIKPGEAQKEPKDEEALVEPEAGKEIEFQRSERASEAAQLNLSAKLSKEGSGSNGNTGSWREVWRLLKIARPEVKTMSVAVGLLVISSAISMSVPASIGKIIDIATNHEAAKDILFGLDIKTFYFALGGVLTLGAIANYGRIILLRIIGERVVTRLRSQLYRNTFIQNAEFFDANRVGDLISRLGSDTIIVGKSITQNVSDGLRSAISGAAGFSLMAYVSTKLTCVLLFMFPPVAIGAFFYGRAIRNLSRKIQTSLGTLTKIAEERLGNVRTSQAFCGEVQEVSRYNTQVRKVFQLGRREAFLSATFFSSSGWAGNMTILALLYVGGGMVQSGAISIGDLTSFLMYTAYAGSSLFGVSGFYSELMKGVGAASRLFELQDRRPTLHPTVGEPVASLRGPITFDHVSFSYPTRPKVSIFQDLTFTIEQGTNVAIVAPSGAGKSTVASLLMRFYVPTSGTIQVNGRDISKMNARQLRRKIGYVGQEPVLFSGSIAENIAYGRPDASRAEIINAARRANCNFISDFPDGLETHAGARGTQLSGGQKQRIAIARALLKQPDILILDEATSALDAESETLVNEALGSLLRSNNTTISIAHRLSTIVRSDRIICIGADGRIAETGSYQELSAKKDGAFNKLMEWQMNGGDTASRREPIAGSIDHEMDGEGHEDLDTPEVNGEEELAKISLKEGTRRDSEDPRR